VYIDTPAPGTVITQGTTANFTATVTGGTGPYLYWWDFGGGASPGSDLEDPGAVAYPSAGSHTVILYVKDAAGTVASSYVVLTVTAVQ
jgi:PKD repeat protein